MELFFVHYVGFVLLFQFFQSVQEKLFENLRSMPFVPSVQMFDLPPPLIDVENIEAEILDNSDPDQRIPSVLKDRLTEAESDIMDLQEGGAHSCDRNWDT